MLDDKNFDDYLCYYILARQENSLDLVTSSVTHQKKIVYKLDIFFKMARSHKNRTKFYRICNEMKKKLPESIPATVTLDLSFFQLLDR